MATGWTAYAYYPSVGGAAVMIMLFLIGVIIFTYQLIRTRAWLTIAALIGGMCMCNAKTCTRPLQLTLGLNCS